MLRVCILGHSGVGKTHLASLFALEGWEPFRVRTPRSDIDAAVCKSPAQYEALLADQADRALVFEGGAPNELRVYEDWSFFNVRDTQQGLEHTAAARDPSASLRIEIFAPVLAEMLEHQDVLDGRAFSLNRDDLVVLLLNPTARSVHDLDEPSDELRLATLFAIRERAVVSDGDFNLADALRRVEHLDAELEAWKRIAKFVPNTVECLRWEHFEYRYFGPRPSGLTQARDSVLAAAPDELAARLEACMPPEV